MKRIAALLIVAAVSGAVIYLTPTPEPPRMSLVEGHEEPRSGKWPAVRKAHLEKEPACVVCGSTKGLQVHHIRPYHLFPAEELSQDNLCTLCGPEGHDCHFIFGHLCDWKSWNPDLREDVKWYRAKVEKAKRVQANGINPQHSQSAVVCVRPQVPYEWRSPLRRLDFRREDATYGPQVVSTKKALLPGLLDTFIDEARSVSGSRSHRNWRWQLGGSGAKMDTLLPGGWGKTYQSD